MSIKNIAVALFSLFAFSTAAAAQVTSFTIPDTSDGSITYEGEFNGSVEGVETSLLSAALSFTADVEMFDADTNQWTFEFELTNTSDAISRVSVFGFDSDPDIDMSTASSTGIFEFVSSGQMADLGKLELCVKDTNGNNCSGGADAGVWSQAGVDADGTRPGPVGTFTLVFLLDKSYSQITLNNFGIRYQAVEGVDCGFDDCGSGTGVLIPEPATWIMMLLGFAAVAVALKSRRRRYGKPELAGAAA